MDQYYVIKKILEKNVESEELDANFEHIDSALKLHWGSSGKSGDKAMGEALLLFKSLQELNDPKNQCNLKAYNILRRNYNAANGLPHRGYVRFWGKLRVNKIVRGFVDRHAEHYSPIYLDLYKEQVKKVDPSLKEFAETLVKNMIFKRHGQEEGNEILGGAEKLFNFGQEYAMTHKIHNDPAYCLQEIRRLAKNVPNSKYTEPQQVEWLGKQILKVIKDELKKIVH